MEGTLIIIHLVISLVIIFAFFSLCSNISEIKSELKEFNGDIDPTITSL
jgi:hypothetical protein